MTDPYNFPDSPTIDQPYGGYKWDGEKWIDTGEDSIEPTGGPSIYISDSPPIDAPTRSLWWDSDTGVLYVRYNDGSSTQWVVAVPPPAALQAGLIPPLMDSTAFVGSSTRFAREDHRHPSDTSRASVSDVTTALAGKAPTSHSHPQTDITNLTSDLAGKAPVSHSHTAAQVTDFSEAVDDRVSSLLTAGANITLAYNDAANSLTISGAAAGTGGITQADADVRYVNISGDTVSGALSVTGGITSTNNYYYFGDGSKYMYWDGSNYRFVGGNLYFPTGVGHFGGNVYAGYTSATSGTYYFGNNTAKYLQCDGTHYTFGGGGEVRINSAGNGWSHSDTTNYRVMSHNNGGYYYLLTTNNGDPNGGYNGLRPFQITLSNGYVNMGHGLGVGGAISSGSISTGAISSSSVAASGPITGGAVTGISLNSSGGGIYASGWGTNPDNSCIFMNYANTHYIGHDVNGFVFAGGNGVGVSLPATPGLIFGGYTGGGSPFAVDVARGSPNWSAGNFQILMMHYAGSWGGFRLVIPGGADFDFRHDSGAFKTGGSTAWQITSDARIKNVVGDYTNGLDAIAALRPVRYVYKGNETLTAPSHARDGHEVPETLQKEPVIAPYVNSMNYGPAVNAMEFIGLVAQEAEVPMPEIVTKSRGYIDGVEVSDLRNMDHTPLIFALINSIKELKARVEQLEARPV